MERNTHRSIIPPMQKPRNGPPRDRDMNSSYHQNSHYNNYNQQNHHQPSPQQQQQQQQQQHNVSSSAPYHPNSDLINFVSSAWKEKLASAEQFKAENTEQKVVNNFDLDGWLNARMRNS